jgi:hypothetical protein
MDVPESLKPKPANALELAKREYHAANIAMGDLDAKVIDAAATLEELKTAFGEAVIRVNDARDALIDARTPPPKEEPGHTGAIAGQGQLAAENHPLPQDAKGADGHGIRPGDMTS